jgi:hypothetical protein
MDKDLRNYNKQTTDQIDALQAVLSSAHADGRQHIIIHIRELFDIHVERVRDFQHERLIHLTVTLFFGGLLLLSIAGGLFVLTLAADPSGPMLNLLAWTLCPLLFATQIFYVRHYYLLENGTQSLYKLTAKLQTLLQTAHKK